MKNRIRWGILSTGHIARKFVSDLRLVPDAEVVAVGSRAIDSARRFAQAHGVPKAYGSWEALAADGTIDVVYVATPTPWHCAAARCCLEAGRPVLVEKPLSLDFASGQDLVAAARAAGLFLMEAMWMRCLPVIREILSLVRGGALGEPTMLLAGFGLPGPFPATHRLRRADLGGGALLDLGVYPVALAQAVFGPPSAVSAVTTADPATGTDLITSFTLAHPSGALAALHCSLAGHLPNTAVICGTAGRIELPGDFFRPRDFLIYQATEPGAIGAEDGRRSELPHDGYGYQFEAAEVHRCLREDLLESPLSPHADSLAVARTLDQVKLSAKRVVAHDRLITPAAQTEG